MSEFESNVCGIPCIIRVTHYDHYQPAFISGPPENCHPAEGGCGDWEVLDRRGRPAPWLERKLNDRERSRIDDEVFEQMEGGDDY